MAVLAQHSEIRLSRWLEVAGVVDDTPVKIVGRVLWNLTPLRVVGIRVVPIRGADPTGPFRPWSASLTAELMHRLLLVGDPSDLRATEVDGLPGMWLIFFEPATSARDPLPEVRKVDRISPRRQQPRPTTPTREIEIPDDIPHPPNSSAQTGRDRAWRLGYLAGKQNSSKASCPYENGKGSGSFYVGWHQGFASATGTRPPSRPTKRRRRK